MRAAGAEAAKQLQKGGGAALHEGDVVELGAQKRRSAYVAAFVPLAVAIAGDVSAARAQGLEKVATAAGVSVHRGFRPGATHLVCEEGEGTPGVARALAALKGVPATRPQWLEALAAACGKGPAAQLPLPPPAALLCPLVGGGLTVSDGESAHATAGCVACKEDGRAGGDNQSLMPSLLTLHHHPVPA